MITNKDRSKWFGASDTPYIMGNWGTRTFAMWWFVKLGIKTNDFNNKYTMAGSYFEGKILDYAGIKKRNRTIKIRKLRLRVNLDGESDMIHEVKTYKGDLNLKKYWQQCQVQMFASKKELEIIAYEMVENDYYNYFNPIDSDRLSRHKIEYDKKWVEEKYLPRLKYLCKCLKQRTFPSEEAKANVS